MTGSMVDTRDSEPPRPPDEADAPRYIGGSGEGFFAKRAAFVAGLVASATAMAISAVVHAVAPSVPFLPVAIAQVLVRITSGGVDSFFIDRLGHWASRLAVAGVCLCFFLTGGLLFRGAMPRETRSEAERLPKRTARAGVLCLIPLWAASVLLYPAAPQYLSRWWFGLVAAAIYAAAGVAGAASFDHITSRAAKPASDASRRAFLVSLAVGGVAAAAGVMDIGGLVRNEPDPSTQALVLPNVRRATRPAQEPGDEAFDAIPGLTPEVTSTSRFYVVNEELVSPRFDLASWRLNVGGAVDRPLSLSFDALTRLPAVERYQTLECISNEVGGQYISTGLFSGVSVREILTRAGVRDGAVQVVFATASGFSDSIGLDAAMDPSTLVVVGLNRHRLPVEHGFPARLLAVGSYGMKNPKWLTDIQVVKQPYQGFWERRGWSKEAIVRTNARIDVPSPGARAAEVRTVAGIAFAGNRGISKVEVSLDGGSTWHPATLKSALSPFTWRLWRFDPEPGSLEGARSVTVRAYDGTGAVQSGRREDPFPKGSSGYHSVSLRP